MRVYLRSLPAAARDAALGVLGAVVRASCRPCWCGKVHLRSTWHDPTHGRIDRDIQEYVARNFNDLDRDSATGRASVCAIESTIQEKRNRGDLSW